MVYKVTITVNGKTMEAIVVEKCKEVKRRRVRKGKTYTWTERVLKIYIPKNITAQRFLVIPADNI